MLSFLVPFLNFFQPGIVWPETAVLRPMLFTCLLGITFGMGSRAAYTRMQALRHPIFFWLVAFIVAQVLSVHDEGFGVMLSELDYWAIFLLFVVAGFVVMSTPETLKRFVWGTILGSMIIVVYGIYAHFSGLEVANQGRAGAYGVYENHNDYSFIIIMVVPFIAIYFTKESGFIRRAFLLASFVACILGIFLSLSRGGILALLLELGLLALMVPPKKLRIPLIACLVVAGSAAISYQWATRAATQGDLYTAEDAETSRFELWKAGENIVLSRPLLGVGSRRFGEFSDQYAEISHDNLGKNAHNTYVDILACSGFLGFIPFLLLIRAIWRAFRQRALRPVSVWLDATRTAGFISLVSILFRSTLDAKSTDWSFYLLAAIGIASSLLQRQLEAGKVPETAVVPISQRRMATGI